jgi:hypothetical protein
VPDDIREHAGSLADAMAAQSKALSVVSSSHMVQLLMTWYYAGFHSGKAAAAGQLRPPASDGHARS